MRDISETEIVEAARAILPEAQALFLFGSRADNSHDGHSDLDLAVLLPSRADPVRLWEAGEAIAHRLNVDVDLIDLRAASTVMQFQIVTRGHRLFAQSDEPERYELFILAEMMDLNEARAPLIADIQREGRVHGR